MCSNLAAHCDLVEVATKLSARLPACAIFLGMLLMPPSVANAQPVGHGPMTDQTVIENDTGFVFYNGEYVEAPYRVELKEGSMLLNGIVFESDSLDLSAYQRRRPRRWDNGNESRRQPGRRGQGANGAGFRSESVSVDQTALRKFREQFATLSWGNVVLLNTGEKPLVLWGEQRGSQLLEILVNEDTTAGKTSAINKLNGNDDEKLVMSQLAIDLVPNATFTQRASAFVEELYSTRARTDSQVAAIGWGHLLNYPLTMFALVLVVFAVGHLMANAQLTFSVKADTLSDEATQTIVRSLAIVGLLSFLDLVWTVIAHQSGSMRELNPIASQFVSDPTMLIAFKVSLTGLSIGLLYWLRELPLTHKATWWCCLTLTLLTARWLTFHSMLA